MTWDEGDHGHLDTAQDKRERDRLTRLAAVKLGWGQAETVNTGRKPDDENHSDRMNLKQGETSAYLPRRLARKAPEVLDRYERGEFKSLREAAKAAGFVKPPC